MKKSSRLRKLNTFKRREARLVDISMEKMGYPPSEELTALRRQFIIDSKTGFAQPRPFVLLSDVTLPSYTCTEDDFKPKKNALTRNAKMMKGTVG